MAASCVPKWLKPMGGTLLIIGAAPCVFADLKLARAKRPDAHVMTINEAAGAVVGEHLLAGHVEKADLFLAYRRKHFPDAAAPYVHGSARNLAMVPKCVTHLWRGVATGGTSAWKAVLVARGMGYEELVLCGCPLDASGYFNPLDTARFRHSCDRIGYGEGRMYQNYRDSFTRRAKEAKTAGWAVYSMSGLSRELLGEVP